MPLWILWTALCGAVVFLVWNSIAWMALPHHHGDFRSTGRGSPLSAALDAARLPPGLYMHPHYADYEKGFSDPELEKAAKGGGRAWLVSTGPSCMGPGTFVAGFALNALEAFGLAWLVHAAGPAPGCLACVVGFAAGVGALARVPAYASQSVWMQLPWRYTATNVFDGVVGYALVGVLVHFLR